MFHPKQDFLLCRLSSALFPWYMCKESSTYSSIHICYQDKVLQPSFHRPQQLLWWKCYWWLGRAALIAQSIFVIKTKFSSLLFTDLSSCCGGSATGGCGCSSCSCCCCCCCCCCCGCSCSSGCSCGCGRCSCTFSIHTCETADESHSPCLLPHNPLTGIGSVH